MPRIRSVTMDGCTLNISPLSFDQAEEFIKESKEMVGREPAPGNEEWAARTFRYVCLSLNKAIGKEEWTPEKLTKELDMVFIQKLFTDFMEMSGFPSKPGEDQATANSTLN